MQLGIKYSIGETFFKAFFAVQHKKGSLIVYINYKLYFSQAFFFGFGPQFSRTSSEGAFKRDILFIKYFCNLSAKFSI